MKNYGLIKLLDADVNTFTTNYGIKIRQLVNPALRRLLKWKTSEHIVIDHYPKLQRNTPYIFASTHGFTNDIIACLSTIDRNAYLLMGSTNQIMYNQLMYAAWLNGFVYVNRLDADNRKSSILKMQRVISHGSSILMFPGGGHNNTESLLCTKPFAGPYTLAKRTGEAVVPMAPFYEFGSDTIYMNVGEPLNLAQYSDKKEALLTLREAWAKLIEENIRRHSTPIKRASLTDDFHQEFLEMRRQEYLKSKWHDNGSIETWDNIWNEELTRYLDKDDRAMEEVYETLSHIHLGKDNLDVMAPFLKELMEQKKTKQLSLKKYMHNKWNK